MHLYNDDFYAYISQGSRDSAQVIVPLVLDEMSIDRMVDVGGGAGAWAKVWEEAGVTTTLVDGDYVENPMVKDFRAHDLSKPIDLGERFDLVQTLEVAEHLPETSASDFVDTLTRHGDIVLFSAAVKGQGGEHHVNEQPVEYWRKNSLNEVTPVLTFCVRKFKTMPMLSHGIDTTLFCSRMK